MAERKTAGISRRTTASAGVQHIIPPDPFTPPERKVQGDSSAVQKFMREHPAGTLPDEPDQSSSGTWVEDGPLPEGETPESISQRQRAEAAAAEALTTPAASTDGQPVAAAPEGATPGKTDAAVAAPPAPAKTEQPAAAATPTPAAPSYAPDEMINLVEGVDPWPRSAVVERLQEFEQSRPLIAEAQRFQKVFGMPAEKAEAEWRPILEIMQKDPERTALLETVLHADPKMLAYLRDSAAFHNSPEAREARGEPAQAERPAQPVQADTLPPKYEKMFNHMREQAIKGRAASEWASAYERYPFLRTNQQARKALADAALALWNSDVAAGKDELEARGLFDAMDQFKVFLEAQSTIAHAAARTAAPVVERTPTQGPEAVLPSTGPALNGARTAAPIGDYRGKNPVDAFLKQYPGR